MEVCPNKKEAQALAKEMHEGDTEVKKYFEEHMASNVKE